MPSISGFSPSPIILNNTNSQVKTQPGNSAVDFIRKNIMAVSNSSENGPRIKDVQPRVDTRHNQKTPADNSAEMTGLKAHIKLANGEVFPASAHPSV